MKASYCKYLILFLLLFPIAKSLQAQQNSIATGVLVDKASKFRIALAEIINLRSGISVGSNDLGIFSIAAQPGDTLMIAKYNYRTERLGVLNSTPVVVNMYPSDNVMLKQVDVYGNSKLQSLQEAANDYRKMGSYYGGKPPLLAAVFQPLTGMYELLGKTPRNARRFGAYYQNEVKQTTVDTKFNRYLIETYTPLRAEDVDNFMFKYRPDFNASQNWNVYQSVDYIKKKYKEYVEAKAEGKDVSIPNISSPADSTKLNR